MMLVKGIRSNLSEFEQTIMRAAMDVLIKAEVKVQEAIALMPAKPPKLLREKAEAMVTLQMNAIEAFRENFFDEPTAGLEWDNRRNKCLPSSPSSPSVS
jgi:hypothetical protein